MCHDAEPRDAFDHPAQELNTDGSGRQPEHGSDRSARGKGEGESGTGGGNCLPRTGNSEALAEPDSGSHREPEPDANTDFDTHSNSDAQTGAPWRSRRGRDRRAGGALSSGR